MSATIRGELIAAVSEAIEIGEHVPCRAGDVIATAAWTSDLPEDQLEAARACRSCAVARLCRAYIAAHPREWGVYGGITEADRKPAKGRPCGTSKRGAAR